MSNVGIIVNTRKIRSSGGKVSATSTEKTCVHTINAEDLRIVRAIPGQGGLGMSLKLKG